MLKELEHNRYLVRKQQKSKNGRFGKSVYFIGDVPLTDKDIELLMKKHGYLSEDFVEDKRSLPLSDYPSAESQSSETPTQTNKIILLPQLNLANNTCQIENFSASENLEIRQYSCGFLP